MRLLITIFCLFSFVFCYCSEDNEYRRAHQSAEAAMNQKDYATAKESYAHLIQLIHGKLLGNPKKDEEWAIYMDVVLRYAQINYLLNEDEECEKILNRLTQRDPPEEYLPQIMAMQARLLCKKNLPSDAYILLHEVEKKIRKDFWKAEDCSFLQALEFMLDSHYESLLQKAHQLSTSQFYEESISLYKEVLAGIENDTFPKARIERSEAFLGKKIRFKIAEAYFYQSKYDQSLELIEESRENLDEEMFYLAAFAHKARHEYEKAVDYLHKYVDSGKRIHLRFYDEAICELGILYYKNGNLQKSKRYLSSLLEPVPNTYTKSHFLAALYFAKISLKEQEPKKAEQILSFFMPKIPLENPLCAEFAYVRGQAAMMCEDYPAAIEMFEKAFSNKKNLNWSCSVCYELAWAYIKHADDPLKREQAQKSFLNKAESLLIKLSKGDSQTVLSENITLALCKIYQLRYDLFLCTESLQEMLSTLSKNKHSFSKEAEFDALLLLGKYDMSYDAREKWYQELSSASFKKCDKYFFGWYYRGLNHFQEGLSHEKDSLRQTQILEKAIYCFQKSFSHISNKDSHTAFETLRSEAQATFYINNSEHRIASYVTLERMLSEYTKVMNPSERIEVLFLKGLVAAQIAQLDHRENYAILSESSFRQLIDAFPNAESCPEALKILGVLYYQRQSFDKSIQFFNELVKDFAHSEQAPEAFFWLLKAHEKIGSAKEEISSIRSQLVTQFPLSEYAEEAIFQEFPISSYFDQEPNALQHLEKFIARYPRSPLAIFAFYCLGISKDCSQHLACCVELFDELLEKNQIVTKSYSQQFFLEKAYELRYRSLLKLAQLDLKDEQYNQAESILSSLKKDFSPLKTELSFFYSKESPYPSFLEEVDYTLAKCLLSQNKEDQAHKLFTVMLDRYALCGIKESYFLAKIWIEQGNMAIKRSDPELALSCYLIAEETGSKKLSQEDFLALWIQQSFCCRMQKQYDLAMRLLSKVINEEAVSPLRLQAMFLRAEIYELEGRLDLAIKQLEATQKKGGSWGLLAEKKLSENYGYR